MCVPVVFLSACPGSLGVPGMQGPARSLSASSPQPTAPACRKNASSDASGTPHGLRVSLKASEITNQNAQGPVNRSLYLTMFPLLADLLWLGRWSPMSMARSLSSSFGHSCSSHSRGEEVPAAEGWAVVNRTPVSPIGNLFLGRFYVEAQTEDTRIHFSPLFTLVLFTQLPLSKSTCFWDIRNITRMLVSHTPLLLAIPPFITSSD